MIGILAFSTAEAKLTASVDRNPVTMNESFTLVLESNESVDGEPDLSVLTSDFEILAKQQSSSMQIINGHTSRSIQWQITLLPLHSGVLTIPAIKVDNQQSQEINLTVNKATSMQNNNDSSDLFIKISTEPDHVYVQQQLLYTIRLYYALDSDINIAKGSTLSEPELETGDAVIKKLGEDKDFQTTVNSRPYRVIQRKYAIFPQQSGNLTIKPVIFEGRLLQQTHNRFRMFDPFQQTTRIKRIQSGSVELDVRPIPEEYTGEHWLPARNVQLVEDWPDIDKDWYAGEPLTRTFALIADGLTSAQLPVITLQVADGIKQYPDQPVIKDTPSDNGFSGVRQEKVALIPSQPGKITFPSVQINWWNTETNKQQTTTLPARTVTILPARTDNSLSTNRQSQPSDPITSSKLNETTASSAENSTIARSETGRFNSYTWWPWLSLTLGVGWLLTLMLWWRQNNKNKPSAQSGKHEAASLKKQIKAIKQACHANDPVQAREALLGWAAQIWKDKAPVNLSDIASYIKDQELVNQIMLLNHSLYAREPANWNGIIFWSSFQNYKQAKIQHEQPGGLAPLYP